MAAYTLPLRILLVEDNPIDRHLTSHLLKQSFRNEHVLHSVGLLAEALEYVKTSIPDIVLLDLGLPDMRGIQVVHSLRSISRRIPIVVLSGSSEQQLAIDAVRAGAHDYVIKQGLTPDGIGRVIRFAIERQKLIDQEHERACELSAAKERAELLASELDESRQRLELALHATKMMLWDWNLVTDTTSFGEGSQELLDYPRNSDDSRMDRWQDLLHFDERTDVLARIHHFLESPRGHYEDTFRIRAADNEWRSVIARGRVIEVGESGQPARMVGTYLDVTERLLIERQLGLSQKLEGIGQLAAGIAHEINTPMQYLGDNIAYLQNSFEELNPVLQQLMAISGREPHDNTDHSAAGGQELFDQAPLRIFLEDAPGALADCAEGVKTVSRIVRAMKEFSHPGNDEKSPIDLNAVIESTVTVARNEWKYLAEVNLELEPGLPSVPALPGELNQVVLNIIVNAAHAIEGTINSAHPKGLITISTRSFDDHVEIRITDTGPGIPLKVRSRIFEPFFTTKEVGKGTGQGLSIAHAVVVQKHGGSLSFETEIGRGTTFIIRLPICEPIENPAGPQIRNAVSLQSACP
jgi:signal transduction histidine kinase